MKLAIDYNLPQGAANEIIRVMKECSASKKSVEEVKQIPRVIKHMYNKMDDRLRLNIGTDSGIKVQVATVPLPDAECFRENRLSSVDIFYIDPRHWFESLPQYYTLGDLLLIETPGHDLQYPKKGIDDFDTSRRLIKLTNTARKKHG